MHMIVLRRVRDRMKMDGKAIPNNRLGHNLRALERLEIYEGERNTLLLGLHPIAGDKSPIRNLERLGEEKKRLVFLHVLSFIKPNDEFFIRCYNTFHSIKNSEVWLNRVGEYWGHFSCQVCACTISFFYLFVCCCLRYDARLYVTFVLSKYMDITSCMCAVCDGWCVRGGHNPYGFVCMHMDEDMCTK
jgi:hypothetical protein